MVKRLRVAVVCGYWGTNIGNAFFNIGGMHILTKMFPGALINFVMDQPGYWTFNNQNRGNQPNTFPLLDNLDIDYLVVQGPLLTVNFPKLWRRTFEALSQRGTKIILLSAALFRYSEAEIRINRSFISEFSPRVLSTRDDKTYEAFHDLTPFSYRGIDSAFFVPDAYSPFRWLGPKYVVLNFDRLPEPNIRCLKPLEGGPDTTSECDFSALGHEWQLQFPKMQFRLARAGKAQSYIGSLLDMRKLPNTVAEHLVVRPEHRSNPYVAWKIYRSSNSMVSDEPYSYFTLYANAALTLSDRVHACVMTLAYGNPAMLFSASPRTALFDRLGLSGIRSRPVSLDPEYLAQEKAQQLAFLVQAVSE